MLSGIQEGRWQGLSGGLLGAVLGAVLLVPGCYENIKGKRSELTLGQDSFEKHM